MKRGIVLLGTIGALLSSYGTAGATVWHVHPDSALSSIQAGIDSSSSADTVLVYPETYVENINFNGKDIVVGSLFLTTGDTSYISSTIIDGGWWGPVVTFENGEDSTALITGLLVRNGTAWQGGGIYCYSSSPSLANVAVSGNDASLRGGGISCYWNSNPDLTHVTISGNSAPEGGGIYCYYNSGPSLTNVTISGNTADEGAGIYCYSSSPSLINVTIEGNAAGERGGGVMCHLSSPILTNATISTNSSPLGGAICCGNSSPTIVNTIVAGNAGTYGGILFYDSPDASITYGDFHNNENGDFFGAVPQDVGAIDTINGNGDSCDTYFNIFLDPMFVDTVAGDYHLQAGSPCVDAGDPDSPLDPDSTIADMGAFYYHQTGIWDENGGESIEPSTFHLLRSFPDPFRERTVIQYGLLRSSAVRIAIYNLLGQETATLIDTEQEAGLHTVIWDGRNNSGRRVPSGPYFLRLETQEYSATRKVSVMR